MYLEKNLYADLNVLRNQGAKVFNIGKTVLGRNIPCVLKGRMKENEPLVLIQASMHAREYPTTPLVMELMKNYFGEVAMLCVPMVNIDGCLLCQQGLRTVKNKAIAENLLRINEGNPDFSLWKANCNAVDLNVNYNANWGTGAFNLTYPSPSNYIGEYPISEPENIALRDLTLKSQPIITLSYHAKGDVIFWGFNNIFPYPDETLEFSLNTGYPLLESSGSAGGYKDWFVATTSKIGLTIEIGSDTLPTPIPLEEIPNIYQTNKEVLYLAEDIAKRIWKTL